ncbi:hypothetical protein HPB50_008853 [Hyalomma asiaticum]|uniref:Uncharacterized protein n=1 Tax=Hyalomma asiaticum TaxID=266040 RepID=A0ACB7SYX8_HYAAI|nr:hypothetical protein HPB50_008853 [Hyalomma asiaticum]
MSPVLGHFASKRSRAVTGAVSRRCEACSKLFTEENMLQQDVCAVEFNSKSYGLDSKDSDISGTGGQTAGKMVHVIGLMAVRLAGGVVSVVLLRSPAAKEVGLHIQEADTLGGAVAEVTGVANLSADEVIEGAWPT